MSNPSATWARFAGVLALALAAAAWAPAVRAQDETTQAAAVEEEASAIGTAERLVAPPGAPLATTELPEGVTTAPLAPGPSVRIESGAIQLATDETTERLAVASGAELLRRLKIAAPRERPEPGTREIDEPTTPPELFDEENIRRLLGDEPAVMYQVIYNGKPLPDPMIVPWVRNVQVLKERFDQALILLSEEKVSEARALLLSIESEFPDTDFAMQSREILRTLDEQEIGMASRSPLLPRMDQRAAVVIQMNPNVKVTSLIADPLRPEDNVAMINGRSYRVGTTLRGLANHRVKEITETGVTITVSVEDQSQDFEISIVRKPLVEGE